MISTNSANIKGYLTILFWSFSALSINYTPDIPPFLLAALTSATGFIIFFGAWVRDKQRFLTAIKQPLPVWALFAMAVIVYRGFYLSGLKLAPTIEANLVQYLWPLLIVVLGSFVDGERLKTRTLFASLLCLLGIYFLGLGKSSNTLEWKFGLGHILALLAAFTWATYSVLTKKFKTEKSDLLGIMHFAAFVFFLVLHLTFELQVNFKQVDIIHYLAVIQLGLAISFGYSWWDIAMKYGDRTKMAIGANCVPLLSTIWLVMFGINSINAFILLGAIFILAGGHLARVGQK